MLFTILPVALVSPAIRPMEDAEALLLIIVVLTLVFAAVGPGEYTPSFHLII